MVKSVKIRLKPTAEQELLMFKSTGVARFAYNWGLVKWQEMYTSGLKPNGMSVKKEFNNTVKKDENFRWLKEVSAQITSQAFMDLQAAFNKFFDRDAEYPKFKSKKKSKKSFYVRYDALRIAGNTVNIEKIGRVEFATNYDIPQLERYVNPRCSFDGKYWYLSFGFEHGEKQVELNKDLSVGIDLGVKELAVISNFENPVKNINKTSKVRKLKKKHRRLSRQISRKYEMNREGEKYVKTKNIVSLERKRALIDRKLKNIRDNHIHHATRAIVDTLPERIVMEDLNTVGMMKNKHLSKAIAEQKLYEFRRQVKYKSKELGIEFVLADRWYPSSKLCSSCGNIRSDLKLSDRTYSCSCGLVMDRDRNAALNLSRYEAS